MQWNGKVNAGFTEGNSSWIPVNSDYQSVNVEVGTYVWQTNSLKNIVMYLFFSDFFYSVGIGSKNKLKGRKSSESSQFLEQEILAPARSLLHLY